LIGDGMGWRVFFIRVECQVVGATRRHFLVFPFS
jgi:hypothetical protein